LRVSGQKKIFRDELFVWVFPFLAGKQFRPVGGNTSVGGMWTYAYTSLKFDLSFGIGLKGPDTGFKSLAFYGLNGAR